MTAPTTKNEETTPAPPQVPPSLIRSVRRFFSGWLEKFEQPDIYDNPVIHHFPDLGNDGQISIDCIIRASAGADFQNTLFHQQPDNRSTGITPLRVGSLHVEINEYGLGLIWQPGQVADQNFLSPFGRTPDSKDATGPAE